MQKPASTFGIMNRPFLGCIRLPARAGEFTQFTWDKSDYRYKFVHAIPQ